MTELELLRSARARIEKGWCQYDPAVDINGKFTYVSSSRAVAWCALGGLMAEAQGVQLDKMILFLERTLGGVVSKWNDQDGRTKEDVLALYDKAIARVQRESA